jgi:hypothetical protein
MMVIQPAFVNSMPIVGEQSDHASRTEDRPVMSASYKGFLLQPVGFCSQNPALDVPPPAPYANGHCCT